MWILFLLGLLAAVTGLLYLGRGFWAWFVGALIVLAWWAWGGLAAPTAFWITAGVVLASGALFGIVPLRRAVLGRPLLRLMTPILPRMSDTEREALEAGTVWWDAELFSGKPRWKELLDYGVPGLSAKEQAFLDGPVEELCAMTNDWEVTQAGDLPEEVWSFLKEHGFFGLIVPEEFGGKGFSAAANSAVVQKLAGRCGPLCVTVMVPNSLGPAELLAHYGTDEQKQHYLPRLASGEEMPCFALTEPGAGSDAGSMKSTGVVCWGEWHGERMLGMRLNWDKRYITLSSVATLLGLAFKLRDPDHILGDKEELGITCALVPTDLPGVEADERHDPLGVPFHNGPTRGKDVFVPIDSIIGGREQAGCGWRMLMQTLAAGRGISLPAMAVGAAKHAVRGVGAYATVREQFGMPIGRFEGIEEPVARIAAKTYVMDAGRRLTVGAIDRGEKPSVLTAIAKAYMTEAMREIVNDAMDVVGGSGIVRGPRNLFATGYQAVPIAITVEGANILTRSMIVFGQGALRCHPFAQTEIDAAGAKDVAAFDRAFFGHVNFVFTNVARAFLLGATGGSLAPAPVRGPLSSTFCDFTRMSAAFALLADVCMGTLGGSLKFREKITGRLADALSWMYLGSATLKRFVDEGQPERDLCFVQWGTQHALHETQRALLGVLDNLPMRWVAWLVRPVLFPLGARFRAPDDRLGTMCARAILDGGEARETLSKGTFVPADGEPGLGLLEQALTAAVAARPAQKKIREAMKAKTLDKRPASTVVERALAAGVLTTEEADHIRRAAELRNEAIQVDSFPGGAYPESVPEPYRAA